MKRVEGLSKEELLADYFYLRVQVENLDNNPNYSEERKKEIIDKFNETELEIMLRM